jgi:D-alanyl-D-alanine carboxypeptidase
MPRINAPHFLFLSLALASISLAACADPRLDRAKSAALSALPGPVAREVVAQAEKDPKRFLNLLAQVEKDEAALPGLLRRVDKAVALPEGFVPPDLVALDGTGLSVSREGHKLRRPAFEALKRMDAAARADAITLLVGSSFRSYAYQVEVYARTVKETGSEAAADRISARPGHSQHQLGMALDFAPIDEGFAETKASRWLSANAARFGFSLSYPKGFEEVTGYSWESWHYRYIGVAACELQKEYFGDVQEYLLLFMEAWKASR